MNVLLQTDPRWSNVLLGASHLTIGRYGCTTTAVAQLSTLWGHPLTPDQIAKRPECYTKPGDKQGEGLIIWEALNLPGLKFDRRIRVYSPSEIIKDISNPNKAVLLQVNYGQHWLLAERKVWFRNDFICADPWLGKMVSAIGDYHVITGSAHFSKV